MVESVTLATYKNIYKYLQRCLLNTYTFRIGRWCFLNFYVTSILAENVFKGIEAKKQMIYGKYKSR